MRLLLTTVILAGAAAVPAFAQDAGMDTSTMTCADFLAMDQTQQMDAMTSIQTAMATDTGTAGADTMATDTAAADTGAAADTMATDTGTDDMAAADTGAAADTTATDTGTTDMAAADAGAADDTMASDAGTDDMAAADAGTTGDMAVTDTQATAAETTTGEAGMTGETDPLLAALMTACEGNTEGLVTEAWTQAQDSMMGTMGSDTADQ